MTKSNFLDEFQLEAVKQVNDRGYSTSDVAKRLGISIQSLYKWLKQHSPDPTARFEAELKEIKIENIRLKTDLRQAQDERDILKKAANEFIQKSTSRDEIIRALDFISTSKVYIPEALSQYSSQHGDTIEMNKNHFNLTPRQKEVLIMIAEGETNKEVGRKLNLSEATVRNHASAIFKTLKASNRTQAVRIAKEQGLLY